MVVGAMAMVCVADSDAACRATFDAFDVDGSDSISASELEVSS